MILIDEKGKMVSDKSERELHAFAKKIGISRDWFNKPPKDVRIPTAASYRHYDLITKALMDRAIQMGAEEVPTRELIYRAWWHNKHLKSTRWKLRQVAREAAKQVKINAEAEEKSVITEKKSEKKSAKKAKKARPRKKDRVGKKVKKA